MLKGSRVQKNNYIVVYIFFLKEMCKNFYREILNILAPAIKDSGGRPGSGTWTTGGNSIHISIYEDWIRGYRVKLEWLVKPRRILFPEGCSNQSYPIMFFSFAIFSYLTFRIIYKVTLLYNLYDWSAPQKCTAGQNTVLAAVFDPGLWIMMKIIRIRILPLTKIRFRP